MKKFKEGKVDKFRLHRDWDEATSNDWCLLDGGNKKNARAVGGSAKPKRGGLGKPGKHEGGCITRPDKENLGPKRGVVSPKKGTGKPALGSSQGRHPHQSPGGFRFCWIFQPAPQGYFED